MHAVQGKIVKDKRYAVFSPLDGQVRPLHVRVRQIGTHGLSPAAVLLLPAYGDD